MTPSDVANLASYGGLGVLVAVLLTAVKVMWGEIQELRKQAREDQERVLPVLTAALSAIEASKQASQQLVAELARAALPHDRG